MWWWRKRTPEQMLERSKRKIEDLNAQIVVEQLKAVYYSNLVKAYKKIV